MGCAGSASAAERPKNDSPARDGRYPNIAIKEADGGSCVYWDGELIVEVRENRYLRFRATRFDEKWLGNQRTSMDLGWHYGDEKVKGLQVLSTRHENRPDEGRFVLRIQGKKPAFDSRNDIVFTGTWMPAVGKFKYNLHMELQCPLESWYENSSLSQRPLAAQTKDAARIEPLDYHVEYISMPDRHASAVHKEPQMYPWFVKSPDGASWVKLPKIHIPYPTRPGKYITIAEPERPIPAGGYFGFLDPQHGGWMTRVVNAPVPVDFGLCWTYFDVHCNLPGAVPPRGSARDLSLQFELAFEPVEPARYEEIIRKAEEIPWRKAPEYRLPLFSIYTENRFDRLINELPGEDTAKQYIWFASSYECDRDDAVGFDDHFSVTIKRDKPSPMPVGWSAGTLDGCYTGKRLANRRLRFSAMVKTANCTGPVRLGYAAPPIEIHYAQPRSHKRDGTAVDPGIWTYSEPVSGTADWTPISMEFTAGRTGRSMIVLEQRGTGQSWFDNVKIEDLGPADSVGKAATAMVSSQPAPQ